MNNLELLLKSKMPQLKKTERRIVRFILAHPARAASLGIKELAGSAGASTASISRLCSKLGFESFKQFHTMLRNLSEGSTSTLAFTSALAGEGRTTAAVNFAIALIPPLPSRSLAP